MKVYENRTGTKASSDSVTLIPCRDGIAEHSLRIIIERGGTMKQTVVLLTDEEWRGLTEQLADMADPKAARRRTG